MKHVIENSGSFSEIFDSFSSDEFENRCLISHEVLEDRHITLPCKHSFNYVPLYTAILLEKEAPNDFRSFLGRNALRCPYCREVFDQVLPYYERDGVKRVRGVNANPPSSTMACFQCAHVFKDARACAVPAHITSVGTYCAKHAAACQQRHARQQRERCNAPLKRGFCKNLALPSGGCRLHPPAPAPAAAPAVGLSP